MTTRSRRRERLRIGLVEPVFPFQPGDFVHVAGEPVEYAVETNIDPRRIDHFWITIAAGSFGALRIALSTFSTKQARAGVNPHLWVAAVASSWTKLPESGITKAPPMNYADLHAVTPLTFSEYLRDDLVALLARKVGQAVFVEAWGELYRRNHLGIHQVHCRRMSPSVRTDYRGRDGAIRFLFAEGSTGETLFFKYFGQP